MNPVKCSECGVWWRGMEHRCQPPTSGVTAVPSLPSGPRHPWWQHGTISGTVSTTTVGTQILVNVNDEPEGVPA